MIVYDLIHLFHHEKDLLFIAPRSLGVYSSLEQVQEAVQYYLTQPGFSQNPNAFSTRQRTVTGAQCSQIVYEAMVYYHTEDYDEEYSFDLGLFTNEEAAIEAMRLYRQHNKNLICPAGLVEEEIINKCTLDQKLWLEGFVIDER